VTADKDDKDIDETSEAVELTDAVEISEPDNAADFGDEKVAKVASTDSVGRRLKRGAGRNIVAILVAIALVTSAGVAAGLYFFQFTPQQQTNTEATNGAIEAAKNGSVALLSYSPDSLDKDFATAKSNLTGDFLSYYTQFTEQIVTPAAKEKKVKTTASIVRAAASEMHPDSAVVLVFINQVTTSKENPDGAFAASAVKVGLTKIDGRWLISAFDPV
jgi:Mce-associated membrane protein